MAVYDLTHESSSLLKVFVMSEMSAWYNEKREIARASKIQYIRNVQVGGWMNMDTYQAGAIRSSVVGGLNIVELNQYVYMREPVAKRERTSSRAGND